MKINKLPKKRTQKLNKFDVVKNSVPTDTSSTIMTTLTSSHIL